MHADLAQVCNWLFVFSRPILACFVCWLCNWLKRIFISHSDCQFLLPVILWLINVFICRWYCSEYNPLQLFSLLWGLSLSPSGSDWMSSVDCSAQKSFWSETDTTNPSVLGLKLFSSFYFLLLRFNVSDVFLVNRLKLEFSDPAFFLPAGARSLFTVGTTADIIRIPPRSYMTLYLCCLSCFLSQFVPSLDWATSIIPFPLPVVEKLYTLLFFFYWLTWKK